MSSCGRFVVLPFLPPLNLFSALRPPLSPTGVSLKTQELYALVFLTRYVDLLFTNPLRSPLTMYNTIMKILFISTSLYIVYQMRTRYKHTYNEAADAFRVPFLIGPAAVAALLFHLKNTVVEVVWAFSIFLEAVAIMPQLFLLQKTGEVENITGHYIFALGAYRGLYALNWVWRAFWEPGYRQWLTWTAGIVQTGLYADFFYHYIRRYVSSEGLLPGRLPSGGASRLCICRACGASRASLLRHWPRRSLARDSRGGACGGSVLRVAFCPPGVATVATIVAGHGGPFVLEGGAAGVMRSERPPCFGNCACFFRCIVHRTALCPVY